MPFPCLRSAVGALVVSLALAAPAHAATRFDAYCGKQGLARSPRQTIVIIDEAHVAPNPKGGSAPQNRAWTRFVGDLIEPAKIEQGRVFAPRERLTVMLARKDGSEPRLLFTGCLPFYSAAEKAALARKAGPVGATLSTYFGSGPAQAAAKDMAKFRTQLGIALVEAAKAESLSRRSLGGASFASSGLLASLRRAPLADLASGSPRIILYSNLNRFTPPARDATGARKAGFALARSAGADFVRADVHVVGVASSANELNRDFFTAWLLGSGGALRGWTASGLGPLEPAPQQVRFYSGVIRYSDINAPMRLRLATTAGGQIVSSWIGVQSDIDVATPFTGDIVDVGGGVQRGRNGNRDLGQLWSADSDAEPEFSADLPFAGMRRLEFTIDSGGALTGKVSDPLVTGIQGSRKPFVEFRLARTNRPF